MTRLCCQFESLGVGPQPPIAMADQYAAVGIADIGRRRGRDRSPRGAGFI